MATIHRYVANSDYTAFLQLLAKKDVEVSSTIRSRIPAETYSQVMVRTVSHSFSGIGGEKKTRMISLGVRPSEKFVLFMKSVFSGLLSLNDCDYTEVDKEKLTQQLITHITCSNSCLKESDEIAKAYSHCSHVDLYISHDLESLEVNVRKDSNILFTYNTCRELRMVIKETNFVFTKIIPLILSQIITLKK